MEFHLTATGCHLPYGITQCYLPPDTNERAVPNPSHAGWYSIYLPRRDGRLSWPSWLDSAPAGSRTSDLSITSPTPNRCTTIIQGTTTSAILSGLSSVISSNLNFRDLLIDGTAFGNIVLDISKYAVFSIIGIETKQYLNQLRFR